jgi:hypothetical protein
VTLQEILDTMAGRIRSLEEQTEALRDALRKQNSEYARHVGDNGAHGLAGWKADQEETLKG